MFKWIWVLQISLYGLPLFSNISMANDSPKLCEGQWYGHWSPHLGQIPPACECNHQNQVWQVISEVELTVDNAPKLCETLCQSAIVPTPSGQCDVLSLALHPLQESTYPAVRKDDVIDIYHGQSVPDPYRWLEDDRSQETENWVQAQNKVTFDYLSRLPLKSKLRREIEGVWNYAKMSTPILVGPEQEGRLFYTYNQGLENQAKLYTRSISEPHQKARVLLDPNRLSKNGTAALKLFKPSKNGHFVAYQIAQSGSDWVEIKVRDVRSGKDLSDHLKWIKFSGIAWHPDGTGFYYSRYAKPEGSRLTGVNEYQMLYFHKLGESQDQDPLIYARSDHKDWGFDSTVTEDGQYLIITVWQGASEKNQLYYQSLNHPQSPIIPLITDFKYSYRFLGNIGNRFLLQTDRDAPKGQIISIQLDQADPSLYKTIIPEQNEALTEAQIIADRFVLHFLKDASSLIKFFNLYGDFQGELPHLGLGSIGRFTGSNSSQSSFFSYRSFSQPTMVYQFNHFNDDLKVIFKPNLKINTQEFKTEQIFVSSKDGTKIPAFLIYSTQAKIKGPRPTVLYGYGGFNISLTPYFKPDLLPWLKMGGMYVVANLRGGGEYGESWHKAGMRENKQNVFDDFISVAESLIATGKTRPDLLGIYGGSNGGLLVGACAQQRPDLFAAAMPAVGVMDMLRFHEFTIGWAWIPEYGDPRIATDFTFLKKYSPLHNLKIGQRAPATMVLTADHDDRVVPAHSFKYAATLQHTYKGGGPTLIRIDTQAGHGAGTPTSKRIDAAADRWAFFAHHLKL